MILETLYSLVGDTLMVIIRMFNIPGLPDDVLESAYNFLDLLMSNASLLGLFIRINTIKVTAVLLIIIFNFEHIYKWFKTIIKKVPFLNHA